MIKNYYDDIVNCVNVLKQQGIIIYPTDTIWGIGCDATQSKPVRRVFNVKKRDEAKALIVLLDDVAKLSYYVNNVPPIAYDLMKQVNTPLTIIYQGARNLAPQCASADGSVAIRIVRDDFCKDLISSFGKPIVSTSANVSGEHTPVIYQEIDNKVLEQADYIVNYKRNVITAVKPSTIIRLTGDWDYEIIRS